MIIRKAHAQGSGKVDLAVYEGLGGFLSKTTKPPTLEEGRRRAANQSDKENGAEENEADAGLERFLHEVVLALFSPEETQMPLEPVRKSRVRLGLTLAERPDTTPTSRGLLASIFDLWLSSERSRPLQGDLEKAKETNARLM